MKISVIIPAYNTEKYIERCIKSILAQTYKNIEIIIIDDGSTDNTNNICRKYKENHDNFIFIRKNNEGAAEARNDGLKIATGDYITFVDSDDWVEKTYIEKVVGIIEKSKCEILINNLTKVKNENKKNEKENKIKYTLINSKKAIEMVMYQKKFDAAVIGKFFSSKCFDNIKFPNNNIYEDIAIICKLFDTAKSIVLTNIKGYFYFVREDGITKSKFTKQKMQLIEVCKENEKFVELKYPEILNATIARTTNSAVHILLQIPKEGYQNEEDKLWKIIKENRLKILGNFKVRLKTKIALLISFLGKDKMLMCYKKTKKFERDKI